MEDIAALFNNAIVGYVVGTTIGALITWLLSRKKLSNHEMHINELRVDVAVLKRQGTVPMVVFVKPGEGVPVSVVAEESAEYEHQEDDRQDALRTMNHLLAHIKEIRDGANSTEEAMVLLRNRLQEVRKAGVLAEKLDEMGFCLTPEQPGVITYSDKTVDYLEFVIPYVEEFGVKRALEEARKVYGPIRRSGPG